MLKSLFKIGANCHRPVDLPDTTRLNWREAIVRCLESDEPRSGMRLDQNPAHHHPAAWSKSQNHRPTSITKWSDSAEDRPEPEPNTSDQMREPATDLATGESVMDSDSARGSSAHCTMAEGEPSSVTVIWIYMQTCPLFSCLRSELSACPELSVCPELFACPEMTTEVVPCPPHSSVGVTMWCVWVGTHHPWTFYLSGFPTQPPSPTSSISVLTIATTVSWQSLCSPSAHHLCGGIAAGLPVSIGVMAGGSLVSASSLWVPESTLALRPSSSTLEPSSLLSAVARQSTSSAGLPRPSGSDLVCCRPSTALGLHSSCYTSSLCQAPPSLRLHLGPLSLQLHRRAITKWSDSAEDRPGARAQHVRPDARAGYRPRHGGERYGQW